MGAPPPRKNGPGSVFTVSILADFWPILDLFWPNFGPFWTIFGHFLTNLGTMGVGVGPKVHPPPLRVVDPPPLRLVDPSPLREKSPPFASNGGVPQGLLLQGPPDGVSRAAQNRRCGAAVDWPAAVAALSKIFPKKNIFRYFLAKNGQNSQKWPKTAKNGPTEPHVIALKRVKMH